MPLIRVRRTGGFVGRPVEGVVDLGSDDDRAAELSDLSARVAGLPLTRSRPYPDGFTYEFDLAGETRRVFEHDLTAELRRIVELVLRPDSAS